MESAVGKLVVPFVASTLFCFLGWHGNGKPAALITVPVADGSSPGAVALRGNTLEFISSGAVPAGHELYVVFTGGSPCSGKVFVARSNGPYPNQCQVTGASGTYPFLTGTDLNKPHSCLTCNIKIP